MTVISFTFYIYYNYYFLIELRFREKIFANPKAICIDKTCGLRNVN